MRTSRSIAILLVATVGCGARTALVVPAQNDASASQDAFVAPFVDAGIDGGRDAGLDGGRDAFIDIDAGIDAWLVDAAPSIDAAPTDGGADAGSCLPNGYAPEQTYAFGNPLSSHPTWVATGDFDHDGDIDLAASGGTDDQLGVWLNHGDGTFADEVPYPGGAWPNQIIAADLDGDGFLDLAIANGDGPCARACNGGIGVSRNRGDGTFASPVYATTGGTFANAVAAGDLDGDGTLDLVATNFTGDSFSVILNRGAMTFAAPTLYAFDLAATVALGDLDANGTLDVVVGARTLHATLMQTWLNDGTGQLALGATYTYGADDASEAYIAPMVFVGEFDETSGADVLATDQVDSLLLLYSGAGAGVLSGPSTFDLGGLPSGATVVDADRDGHLDFASTVTLASGTTFTTSVDVLANDGHGGFGSPTAYPAFEPSGLTAADFNGDGIPDFAFGSLSWVSVISSRCE